MCLLQYLQIKMYHDTILVSFFVRKTLTKSSRATTVQDSMELTT